MNKSICSDIINLLKENIYQYDIFMRGYKEKNNVKYAALLCDCLPSEILYSSGYIPLRIPSFQLIKDCCSFFNNTKCNFDDLYDIIIVPQGCINKKFYENQKVKVFKYNNPPGYGNDFSTLMNKELKRLFNETGSVELNGLSKVTEMYNIIRRQIRGISSERKNKPEIISYCEFNLLLEAAMILPPEIINQYLNMIIEKISAEKNNDKTLSVNQMINSFIYTSFINDETLFDEIEELGFNIFEDDSCSGRRQFDISVNAESENLYDEIIHAYSFKPYCSSKRIVEERYELLYKLLKSHDAELVIFIEDLCCKIKKEHIDFLRVKLMRSGVDVLKISSNDAIGQLKLYKEKSLNKL